MKQTTELIVKITILGVGGGGSNAVNRMIEDAIPMVKYITVNTDTGAVKHSKSDVSLQIGLKETRGLGAGSNAEKGRQSALEDLGILKKAIQGCDMLFITAGMGGGTGTGAAPVVAALARELGILTVAVVTKPFAFEGKQRMERALVGIKELEGQVDAMVVIPNDNLKFVSEENVSLNNAFQIADEVLVQSTRNIIEIIQNTAFINCDFADISSILKDSGYMHTRTGEASGKGKNEDIVNQIVTSRLLETAVDGASGVLLYVTASEDVGLEDVEEISAAIAERAAPSANIIFGMNFDEEMVDRIRVTLIATGERSQL